MVTTRSKTSPARRRRADFFSHPSEEEVIEAFLRTRVSGVKSCAFIHDADVYAAGPADLTNEFAPAVASNGDRAWYFFSPVRAKSREGRRKARTVDTGDGCWHSEAGAKPVVVEEPWRRLGHRQSFSFVTKVDGRRVRSGWLMVELGLEGADHVVLCKIYFSPRANAAAASSSAARKRKAAADDDDDKNPAPARRRRPAEAAAPHANDTAGGGEMDNTRGGVPVDEEEPAADEPESIFAWLARNKEECRALGYVDRPDEEIQRDYGLGEMMALLGELGKGGLEMPPPYDTAGDRAYPACLSLEQLYSTSPLVRRSSRLR